MAAMAIGPTDDRRRAFDGLIGDQRAAFDVPADVAYFNTASLAPQLRAVRAAGQTVVCKGIISAAAALPGAAR